LLVYTTRPFSPESEHTCNGSIQVCIAHFKSILGLHELGVS